LRFKAPLTISNLVFGGYKAMVILCMPCARRSRLIWTAPTSISFEHGYLPAILAVLCTIQADGTNLADDLS
jgi:hypothetical protein